MELNTIFFIGPQGSGKGTQAKILAAKLGFFHWDMGRILRETAASGTELGRRIKELIDNGIYLTDDFLIEVAKSKLETLEPSQGIIFDGIPRRLGQAEFLMKFLQQQDRSGFVTLFVSIPKEESLRRLTLRAQTEGRADDTPEKIERRLQQYFDDTVPVLDFLKAQTKFVEIDGTPSIDEVTAKINFELGLQ